MIHDRRGSDREASLVELAEAEAAGATVRDCIEG
jgi:hypothetical protein